MNETIELTYTAKGHPPIRLTLFADWVAVADWCASRLYPNFDVNAPDPVFDKILAKLMEKK